MKFTTVYFLISFSLYQLVSVACAEERDHYFRFFVNTPLQGVDFYQGEDASSGVSFKPNSVALTSFTVGYKDLYAGVSFKGKEESPEKGKTHFSSYRLTYNFYKFAFKAYYQTFKGFYVEDVLKNDGSYYTFSNFNTKNYGLIINYYFSKDYIRGVETAEFHRLMQDQANKNIKASSWFFKLGYDDNKLNNIPQGDAGFSTEPESDYLEMSSGEFKTLSLAMGIDFYYIFSNFFIDFKLSIGPGFQKQNFTSRGAAIEQSETSSVLDLDINFGIHIAKMILSLQIESQRIESDLQFNRGFTSAGEVVGLSLSKVF